MIEKCPVRIKEPVVPCWDDGSQAVINLPASKVDTMIGNPLLPSSSLSADEKSISLAKHTPHKVIFPLCPDHLITLLQYNVLRATIINIQILAPLLKITTCSTDHLNVMPEPTLPQSIPPAFWPTKLQQIIPHED